MLTLKVDEQKGNEGVKAGPSGRNCIGFGFHTHVYITPAGILHALRILTLSEKL
jgi:hypothetical protein